MRVRASLFLSLAELVVRRMTNDIDAEIALIMICAKLATRRILIHVTTSS